MFIPWQFPGMRKPQEFVVYPRSDTDDVIVQSDKSIGRFNPVTRQGTFNRKGCYFIHLTPGIRGLEQMTFPEEFVALCLTPAK